MRIKLNLEYSLFFIYTEMKILVFDTETTGLPERGAKLQELEKWPHVVQLSYVVYDVDKNSLVTVEDDIIKLENMVIPEESTKIHGITQEISQNQGIPIRDAILKFAVYLEKCQMYIGHNITFDKNIIIVELSRLGYNNIFKQHNLIEYCTMKMSVNFMKLPHEKPRGREKYKYPKLIELYERLFNERPGNLHNALTDVMCTLRCFYKLYCQNKDLCVMNEDIKDCLYKQIQN
jgi:DNA polymerase III epsilon subunit-like protein